MHARAPTTHTDEPAMAAFEILDLTHPCLIFPSDGDQRPEDDDTKMTQDEVGAREPVPSPQLLRDSVSPCCPY